MHTSKNQTKRYLPILLLKCHNLKFALLLLGDQQSHAIGYSFDPRCGHCFQKQMDSVVIASIRLGSLVGLHANSFLFISMRYANAGSFQENPSRKAGGSKSHKKPHCSRALRMDWTSIAVLKKVSEVQVSKCTARKKKNETVKISLVLIERR